MAQYTASINWTQEIVTLSGNYAPDINWVPYSGNTLIGLFDDHKNQETYVIHISQQNGNIITTKNLTDISTGSAEIYRFPNNEVAITFVNREYDYHANFGFISESLSHSITDRFDVTNFSYISLAQSSTLDTSILGVMEPGVDWTLNLIKVNELGDFVSDEEQVTHITSYNINSDRSIGDLLYLSNDQLVVAGWYNDRSAGAGAETFFQIIDTTSNVISEEYLAHTWRAGSQWYVDSLDLGNNEFAMFYNDNNTTLKVSKFNYDGELLSADVVLHDLN